MAVAVVDDGGNLKAQHKMGGASLAAIKVSPDKAYTALATNTSTEALAEQCQAGPPLYGLQADYRPRTAPAGSASPPRYVPKPSFTRSPSKMSTSLTNARVWFL